ncbi:MAG TPA: glycosyl transferase family 2 [Cytophagales bacterium]|jgi:teichuronic acid biosynthesis glycosyltransferase TuaG|nr:glycosyl transferase family 2 [Cytophagales bacterium]
MPAYNAAPYIEEAIQSAINQSHRNFELLIINDGSTDNTKDIIQLFKDPRVKYFSQQNKGVSYARNVGLKVMKGDFFCFLDADDVLPQRSLESRLSVFRSDENIKFVDGKVLIKNKYLTKIIKSWEPKFQGPPLEELLMLSGKNFLGNTWMIRWHKDQLYWFKEGLSHSEDLLFYINLAKRGGLYAYTNEIVLIYRQGHQSAMTDLKGLEKGYRSVYQEVCNMPEISKTLRTKYLKKAKSIMFKSYFSAFQVKLGLKTLISKW